MLIHFSQSSYFKTNGGVDRYFLETFLLPGLTRQAVIAGGSRGVELPVGVGQAPEYLSLDEAKSLVLDWLTQNHNLLGSDKLKLEKIKNYEQFANLASNLYENRVHDQNKLLTAARLQNVADLRAKKLEGATTSTPSYDQGKVIDQYNALYLKLLSYSRVGVPKTLLAQISLTGLKPDVLATLISTHLPRLYAAGSVGSSPEAQNHAVAYELGEIIKSSYPELSDYLNILGSPETAASLRQVTAQLKEDLSREKTSLLDYERLQLESASAADLLLLNQSELKTAIEKALPSLSAADRQNFSTALLKEMVSSAGAPLTATEIIASVSQKLGIPTTELAHIQSALSDAGVSVSLEYRQNELALKVGSNYLTRGEINLLRRGIDPFLAVKFQESKTLTQSQLQAASASLLASYNSSHATSFTSLTDAYQAELDSPTRSMEFIHHARSLNNHLYFYDNLAPGEEALIRRTRFGRAVTDLRSRFYETQNKFFDKWIDLEETLTGKKWLHKQLDRWDKFAEGAMIPGTKIPFFRLVPWFFDQIDAWKKATTLKNIARFSTSKNWFGQSIHWALKKYELGGFTTSGAIGVVAHAAWSKAIYWASGRIVKDGAVFASRTALRLLLKIGGRALIRLGGEGLIAALGAASIIGTIIGVALMVWEVVKFAWNFVKEFIQNIEFRKTVQKWAYGALAIMGSIQFAPFLLAIGAIVGPALIIVLGILFITPQIQNNIKSTFNLDSGITQFVTSILCDDSEDETAPTNSIVSCASCLVDYLTACYGQEVTSSDMQTTGIGCLLAKAVAPEVAAEIEASATSYNYLQCVGFVQAAVACSGGSLEGRAVAADYITSPASGYRYVSGAASCQPGDIGLIDGDIGHIFVVGSNNNATINAIDANYVCNGCVSSNTPLPASSVAGCMKKI